MTLTSTSEPVRMDSTQGGPESAYPSVERIKQAY